MALSSTDRQKTSGETKIFTTGRHTSRDETKIFTIGNDLNTTIDRISEAKSKYLLSVMASALLIDKIPEANPNSSTISKGFTTIDGSDIQLIPKIKELPVVHSRVLVVKTKNR